MDNKFALAGAAVYTH